MTDRWLGIRVRQVDPHLAPLVSELLMEMGGRAVLEEERDLTTYLLPSPDPGTQVAQLERSLAELVGPSGPAPEVSWWWQPQEDWAELWKQGLGPREVGDRVLVVPSWEPRPDASGRVVITIDPGMAFGTAEHATTRGALRLMEGVVAPGERILDLGAGSAILAIAAARLGASAVLAVESDPLACEAASENLEANGVADAVELLNHYATAEWISSLDPVDGAVANIEAGFLRPLLPGIARVVRPGGWVVLSGILRDQRADVLNEALAQGLIADGEDAEDEWWSGRFIRPARRGS